MLTIVFYASDGTAAKARAKAIAADKPNTARVYDAMVWNGDADACDAVEIMPCVPGWKREAIEAAFSGKIEQRIPADAPEVAEAFDKIFGGNLAPHVQSAMDEAPKRRGRPPGSKNRAA